MKVVFNNFEELYEYIYSAKMYDFYKYEFKDEEYYVGEARFLGFPLKDDEIYKILLKQQRLLKLKKLNETK